MRARHRVRLTDYLCEARLLCLLRSEALLPGDHKRLWLLEAYGDLPYLEHLEIFQPLVPRNRAPVAMIPRIKSYLSSLSYALFRRAIHLPHTRVDYSYGRF